MTEQALPLSPNQEALWIDWSLGTRAPVDVLSCPFAVEGDLDVDVLSDAVRALGWRYPQLRGRIAEEGDVPELRGPSGAAPLELAARRVEDAERTATTEIGRIPFDLAAGPLCRVDLLTDAGSRWLVLTFHHVVTDGVGIMVLLDALVRAYAGADLGEQPESERAALRAHAEARRESATGPGGAEDREFWAGALDGVPAPVYATDPSVPVPAPPEALRVLARELDGELAGAVERVASEVGATPFALLFGAHVAAWARRAGRDDVVVSLPSAGRRDPALRPLVAFLVNPVPVRVRLVPDRMTWRELIGRVTTSIRATLPHAGLPRPAIVTAGGPAAREVVEEALFQYWDTRAPGDADGSAPVLVRGARRATLRLAPLLDASDYRVQANVRVDTDRLVLQWKDRRGELGDALDGLLADFEANLRAIVADPDAPVPSRARADDALPPVLLRREEHETDDGSDAPATAAVPTGQAPPATVLAAFLATVSWYADQAELPLAAGRDRVAVTVDPELTLPALGEVAHGVLTAPQSRPLAPRVPEDAARSVTLAVRRGPGPGSGPSSRELRLELDTVSGGARVVAGPGLDPVGAADLARHTGRLLAEGCAHPERAVGDIDPLDEDERHARIVDWNDTADTYPEAGLVALLADAARRAPGAVALACPDGSRVTYDALLARVRGLAGALLARGVAPGDMVGVCLPRGPELVTVLLAVLAAGAAYVPLDPAAPVERRRFMVADARADLVVGEPEPGLDNAVIVDPATLAADAEPSAALPTPGPDDLAYCIYTSGTTGSPKGVPITHRHVVRLVLARGLPLELTADDTWTLHHACHFDVSVWEIFGCLLRGARLVVLGEDDVRDAARLLDVLARERVTVLGQTPSAFGHLAEARAQREVTLPALRYVIFAGERLDPTVLRDWRATHPGVAFLNMYGITEATVHSTVHEVTDAEIASGRVSVGRPLPTTRLYLLDRRGARFVPVGTVGEIHAGGAGITPGYLRRPHLVAERFRADPHAPGRLFRSGDLARQDAHGRLEVLGRRDTQIKVRGYRVEVGEIESALRALPGVRDAVVELVGGSEGELVAFVHGRAGGNEVLRAGLAAVLPAYMVPTSYVPIEAVPLTRNGKRDRAALRALAADRHRASGAAAEHTADGGDDAPRGTTARVVAGVWRELLGVDRVGTGSSFFALGGHSLLANRAAVRLRAELGGEVPIRMLFEHRTLGALAAALDDRPAAPAPAAAHDGGGDREGAAVVAPVQQRIGLAERVDPAAHRYLVPVLLRVRGMLELEALRTAVRRVVGEHEVLRTRYEVDDGRVVGTVLPDVEPDVAEIPFDGEPDEERVDAWLRTELDRPMDAERGLLRVRLLRGEDGSAVLAVIAHHLVWDLHSTGAFLAALDGDRPSGPRRFHEVVREDERGDDAGRAHWARRLADAPALPPFALPVVEQPSGAVPIPIAPDAPAAVAAFAAERGVSRFMLVAAALALVLHRRSGEPDVTFGSTSSRREALAAQDVIGPLVDVVPLRSRLPAGAASTVGAVLDGIRDAVLDGLDHPLAFEEIVAATRPARRPQWIPFAEVMLNMTSTDVADHGALGTTFEVIEVPAQAEYDTKFALTVTVVEDHGSLRGTVSWRGDRIEPMEAREVAADLGWLLGALPGLVDDPVADLPFAARGDERALAALECGAHAGATDLVPELVRARIRDHGEATAVDGGGGHLTYAALDRRSAALAARLAALAPETGAVVATLLPTGPDLVVAMLAAWRAGLAYCPLDPAYPRARVQQVLADLRPVAVVGDPGAVGEPGAPVLAPEVPDTGPATRDEWPATPPEQVAYVVYTSGTTGRPKGVRVTHGGLAALVGWHVRAFGLTAEDRCSTVASPGFDAAQWEAWPALSVGASLWAHGPHAYGAPVARWLERTGITVAFLPTAVAESVWAAGVAPASLRWMLFGGGALLGDLPERPPYALCNAYGPTENTVVATALVTDPDAPRPRGDIGRPVDGTRVVLLDAQGRRSPIGAVGEIHLAGASVAEGYHRDPEGTAAAFVVRDLGDGPVRTYRTGDEARWRDGTLEFLGRRDRQIEVRGHRIEPREVELALTAVAGVEHAVVVAREGRLVAYVTGRGAPPEAAVRDDVATRLPAFMVPAAVRHLAAMPLTAHGKVDESRLPAVRDPGDGGGHTGNDSGRDPMRDRVLGLWSEVLGRDHVGWDDNFFDVGGDSVLLARVHSAIEADTGRELRLADLFSQPTPRLMAAWWNGLRRPEGEDDGVVTAGAANGHWTGPGGVAQRARAQRRRRGGRS